MTNPAVLTEFDGTAVPNRDRQATRRPLGALAKAAGVPDSVYDGLYIVEIIEASQAWLSNQDTALANSAEAYAAASHQRINDIEMQAASNTAPFTAVRPVLNQLRDKGYRLGIVTRNCRAAVLTMFPDMDEYVDCLHARDDVVHLKPDPRHLQDNLDALGAEAASSVMVGDGALDMQAGQALGMRCVGVLTGSNDTHALTDAGATEVLADYRGLVSLLT